MSDCDCPKSSVTSVVRTSSMVFKYLMLDVALELMVVSESTKCLQCFDAVGWAAGRASGL